MADDDGDTRTGIGEAAGEQAREADAAPIAVFADTMPAPVPSVSDGHPVELGAPRAVHPRWYDLILGNVLAKAVSALHPDGDRIAE